MLFKDLWWLIRRYWLIVLVLALIVSHAMMWRYVVDVRGDLDYLWWRTLKQPRQ